MARAMWSGAIGFGMVNIPVKLYTATSSKNVSFHLIHAECKTRIKEVRWCTECDRQVEWEEIEKGYEYAKSRYITLTDEDFEELPLPSKNIVQVTSFVKLEEMDPIYFEKSYYLEPEKTGAHPYNLFLHSLIEKKMIGIGTVALRTKERLCALRPCGDTLLLSTLLYPDEIKIDLDASAPSAKLSKQEMTMASNLIDLLAEDFQPEKYSDHYREALAKLIDSKLEGEDLEEEEKPRRAGKEEVLSLMDALEASLSKMKGANKSNSAKEANEEADIESEAEAKPRSRRKTATKQSEKSDSAKKPKVGASRKRSKSAAPEKRRTTAHKSRAKTRRGAA